MDSDKEIGQNEIESRKSEFFKLLKSRGHCSR